jgi:N-glycosylase/DNA lyase
MNEESRYEMIELTIEKSFNIEQILECGQCFRFEKLENQGYELIALNHRLRVKQSFDKVRFDCDESTFNNIWRPYFDMNRDYESIKDKLMALDRGLRVAVEDKQGLRVLRQDPFEMILTFILSQNKAIPQIKVLVQRLSETYGNKVEDHYGTYYCFPTVAQLSGVTEEDYRLLKVGFRAPYLVDAVRMISRGEIELTKLYEEDSNEARRTLMGIKGVGQKVADCVLLFAYGKVDVFPLDVWVRRMMIHTYFKGEIIKDEKILEFATTYFEGIGGLAQQYLFYYGRDHKIGK